MTILGSARLIASLDEDFAVVRSKSWFSDLYSAHGGDSHVTVTPDARTVLDQPAFVAVAGFEGGDILTGGSGDDFLISSAERGHDRFTTLSGLLADHRVEDFAGWGSGAAHVISDNGETDVLTDWDPGHFPGRSADKSSDGAEVLPGVSDDDFLIGKDGDMPLVLPGVDDIEPGPLFRDQFTQPTQRVDHMLTLGQDGFLLDPTEDLGRLLDHDGWLF